MIYIRESYLLHRNWKRWESTRDGFIYSYDVHMKVVRQYTQALCVNLINLQNSAMQFYKVIYELLNETVNFTVFIWLSTHKSIGVV
jgi:hypothetical protein